MPTDRAGTRHPIVEVDMSEQIRRLYFNARAHGRPFAARTLDYHRTGWYQRMDYVSIVAVIAGRGRMATVDRRTGRPRQEALMPGRMFLLRPPDVTKIEEDHPGGVSVAWVAFPVPDWRSFATLAGFDPEWETSPDLPTGTIDPTDSVTIRAFEVAIEQYRDEPTVLDLIQFWLTVAPKVVRLRADRTAKGPPWLSECIEAMHSEENLRAGLLRLHELVPVSAPYLAALTRRFYRKTPIALVTELRLRHAAFLLRSTRDSIGAIAERCGFSSPMYFSNRFRIAYGLSPREYRAGSSNTYPEETEVLDLRFFDAGL